MMQTFCLRSYVAKAQVQDYAEEEEEAGRQPWSSVSCSESHQTYLCIRRAARQLQCVMMGMDVMF